VLALTNICVLAFTVICVLVFTVFCTVCTVFCFVLFRLCIHFIVTCSVCNNNTLVGDLNTASMPAHSVPVGSREVMHLCT
jgi:hypothetical protein